MGHVYTPGLKVKEAIYLEKVRILPLEGEVTVSENEAVAPSTVIARSFLPGAARSVNLAGNLGVEPANVKVFMLKSEGDEINEGEIYAQSKGFLGLFKTKIRAPFSGSIDSISKITGQAILRQKPVPVEKRAYMKGTVKKIIEKFGVVVGTRATFIQGIFGIGGEKFGKIVLAVDDNEQVLTRDKIKEEHQGKIVVGGSFVTADALKKAIDLGVSGVVAGGFNDKDLRDFLGYDIGVAITGSESINTTLVITEGFGEIPMAPYTFALLKKREGEESSINGATQIRAGVIRPEIIIPFSSEQLDKMEGVAVSDIQEETKGVETGSKIRAIRAPYFGKIGDVVELLPETQQLESESKARVLKVKFKNDEIAIIPRANVEIIEE